MGVHSLFHPLLLAGTKLASCFRAFHILVTKLDTTDKIIDQHYFCLLSEGDA